MKESELLHAVLEKLSFPQMHPLHKAMMEECCENAIKSNPELDSNTLVSLVQLSFMTCDTTLKATLKAAIESVDADEVNLNYRNQTFTIKKDSGFLANPNTI